MSDKATIPPKAKMAEKHPKHRHMLASLHQAVEEDKELKPWAWARGAEGSHVAS